MWKTIKYSIKGKPLIDVNEQGVFYSYRSKSLKPLKINRDKHPYYCYTDYCYTDAGKKGKIYTHYAHIEVAKAFPNICGKWFEGCQVHHKDGNSLNNEAKNLIVCTPEQHKEFHRQMKIKEMKRIKEEERAAELKSEREEFFKDVFGLENKDEYTYHYCCRKSKVDKNGYSPIELWVYKKKEGTRKMISTGFKQKPEDFRKGIMPIGFESFNDKLYS